MNRTTPAVDDRSGRIDRGQIHAMGGVEEVVRAHEGQEAARYVAALPAETTSHG